jgi:hypothetical protein
MVICFFPDCAEADSCAVAGEHAFVVDAGLRAAVVEADVAAVVVPVAEVCVVAELHVPVVQASVVAADVVEQVSARLMEHNVSEQTEDLFSAVDCADDYLQRSHDLHLQGIEDCVLVEPLMVEQVEFLPLHAARVKVDS